MRKLKLAAEELVVETFAPAVTSDEPKGTVRANATNDIDAGCTIYVACTRDDSCYVEQCWEQPTNSPIYRQCYTPYVECSTEGYTCAFSCVYCQFPITSDCPA